MQVDPASRGQVAVVTGANSGLGLSTACALAERGVRVVLACRDSLRASDAMATIMARHPRANLEFVQIDLADLESVAVAADKINAMTSSLHILINNAGVLAPPLTRTVQGFELQFGVNHLGHFALTRKLLPLLTQTYRSRVVTVTSAAHYLGRMAFDNLNAERGYRKWRAYHQSKLANMLFTNEMQRRYPAGSNGPLALAAHPGYAATNLQTRIPFGSLGNALLAQSASRGAASILHAATAPNLPPATLWGPDGFLQLRGAPTRLRPARRALNDDDAYRLWQISEELTDG